MSIGGHLPLVSGLAGVPLAQARGKEVDRVSEEVAQQSHRLASQRAAEAASGIGETDGQDHHTEERDADGRRPWEIPIGTKKAGTSSPTAEDGPRSARSVGNVGQIVDLLG